MWHHEMRCYSGAFSGISRKYGHRWGNLDVKTHKIRPKSLLTTKILQKWCVFAHFWGAFCKYGGKRGFLDVNLPNMGENGWNWTKNTQKWHKNGTNHRINRYFGGKLQNVWRFWGILAKCLRKMAKCFENWVKKGLKSPKMACFCSFLGTFWAKFAYMGGNGGFFTEFGEICTNFHTI